MRKACFYNQQSHNREELQRRKFTKWWQGEAILTITNLDNVILHEVAIGLVHLYLFWSHLYPHPHFNTDSLSCNLSLKLASEASLASTTFSNFKIERFPLSCQNSLNSLMLELPFFSQNKRSLFSETFQSTH